MLDRSSSGALSWASTANPPMGGGDIDAAHILGLLAEAQSLLRRDPARAGQCLDHVCDLLRRDSPMPDDNGALLPRRPDGHQSPPTGGLAGWQLRRVIAHVESRLCRNLSTDELALVASLSPGHFCRAFKVSMGETPHAYVIRQRIRRAQWLMLETGHSLSDIASACGLTDQAHLTRLFKRLVGTTPLSWRRTWQGSALAAPA